MVRLSCYPVFDSYLLVLVIALGLLAVLWFGPSRRKVAGWRRWLLFVPRLVVIALVIFAMLRPTLIYTKTTKEAATLVVLTDQSRSMTVPDAVGNKTRWEALCAAVADAQTELGKLQREFEVKAYGFAADLHPLDVEGGAIALPEQPEGMQTAIGASLEDVMRREAGKRLLGIVLLSDGAQRAYPPRDLPAQTAAARLRHLGVPLYTLPFGQSRGLGEAQDVAIKDLIASPTVYVKNELVVRGQVRIDGYVNRAIPVRLLYETAPGKMEVVAEETVKAASDGQLVPVQLSYVPETPGEYKVTLEVADQAGELVTTNNQLSTFVNVLGGGLNVLYLEGTLRVETNFVRRALDGAPNIKVDYVRLDARDKRGRPADMAAWFQPGKYNVYILGDLDASAFTDDELAHLAECVNRGAGLLMLGGQQSFGPGGYGDTPLAKVLPVGMERLERQDPNAPLRSDLHWPGPLPMRPTDIGKTHFALTLAGNAKDSDAVWEKLPPLDGANKLHDLSPGARVLADAGEKIPLLVTQDYGSGRVLAFAADSTWHWVMRGFASAHARFWRQMILWLAHRDQAQEEGVWVRLAQRRMMPGQRVELTAGARSHTGEPIADAAFKAEVILPDGARQPLSLTRQDEEMTGSFRNTQMAGDYAIEVTASDKDKPLGSARARFLVSPQDLELDNASADAATLESLAAMTRGETLAPEQLPGLIQRLMADTQQLDVQQETKETFWDTWLFFLILVGLLGVEWYLRKRWGLV